MDGGDSRAADQARLDRIFERRANAPKRCTPYAIEEFLAALRVLLQDAGGLSGDRVHKDLRIAQVIGNLGDCYHMEDQEYLAHVWEAAD